MSSLLKYIARRFQHSLWWKLLLNIWWNWLLRNNCDQTSFGFIWSCTWTLRYYRYLSRFFRTRFNTCDWFLRGKSWWWINWTLWCFICNYFYRRRGFTADNLFFTFACSIFTFGNCFFTFTWFLNDRVLLTSWFMSKFWSNLRCMNKNFFLTTAGLWVFLSI